MDIERNVISSMRGRQFVYKYTDTDTNQCIGNFVAWIDTEYNTRIIKNKKYKKY